MNFKNISDQILLSTTRDLALREREMTTQILWHLREIESRRLFAALGYASLFAYAVKELHYSDGAAVRRVNAMRLQGKRIKNVSPKGRLGGIARSSHRFSVCL
jgi:hypothetical protein